jgi:putative nucleotidyltransferase with HDIG domain
MLDNIRQHSLVVARVAELIASGLIKAGVDLALDRIIVGALLHDIGKTICLEQGGDHALVGKEICLQRKLHEVADIVGEHVRLRDFQPQGKISEKEIVYYADKRVNHSSVVTLDQRLHYILDRYGGNNSEICRRIRANFLQCRMVEEKLFARLDYLPSDIAAILEGTRRLSSHLPNGYTLGDRY